MPIKANKIDNNDYSIIIYLGVTCFKQVLHHSFRGTICGRVVPHFYAPGVFKSVGLKLMCPLAVMQGK